MEESASIKTDNANGGFKGGGSRRGLQVKWS